MSLALYKNGLKGCWKLLLVLAAALSLYFIIIVTMFDPELGSILDEFAAAMPEMMAAVGMTSAGASLVEFMASYLYGFIMLVFPMIFSIITANRLVSQKLDRGDMAYLLAAPVPKLKIALTQIGVLATGIILLVGYATLIGIISCQTFFPGDLDIPRFLMMNLGALALQLLIGGICFLSSSIFNETKYSVAFGAGIPALGFIIQMLGNAGEDLDAAKYATFFTLFDANSIAAGKSDAYWGILVLAAGALVLFGLAATIFNRKDIPV